MSEYRRTVELFFPSLSPWLRVSTATYAASVVAGQAVKTETALFKAKNHVNEFGDRDKK